jgi:hypothetical protein
MTPLKTLTLAAYFRADRPGDLRRHRYYLVYLYMRKDKEPKPGHRSIPLPVVTIQLPL